MELSRKLAADYTSAPLDAADRAMLDYCVRLTQMPLGSDNGIEALRTAGFDDRAVLDICQVAAYYNYVNRLADGLGVELEPYWSDEELTMTATEFEARLEGHQHSREPGDRP